MPHAEVMRAIELLGTRVASVVRRELADTAGAEAEAGAEDPIRED